MMGSTYIQTGKFNQAFRYLSQCKQIYEKYFNKRHPDYLTLLNRLSSALLKVGSFSEAFDLLRVCLNLSKDAFGDKHPDYLSNLNDMGILLSQINRPEASLEYYFQL